VSTDGLRRLETRLCERLDWVAAGLLAVAFLLRWRLASETYLNPDEAWVSLLAAPGSLGELYAQATRTAHPPLAVFLLHAVKRLSDSELALRFIPLLAGVLVPWLVYRWLGCIWSRTAGFLALVLLAFSPALTALSAQVRGYTLLLVFVAAALYWLERALREDSPFWIGAFTAALYLAILTEYSAAFFAVSAALYFMWRARARRLRPAVWLTWLVGQASGALIYVGLLYTQVLPRLERARTSGEFESWLAPLFPSPGEPPWGVLVRGMLAQLRYLFAAEWAPAACALLWPLGIALLARRARALLVLFAAPILLMWLAALARLHPYTGSRHCILLALFLAAGVAVAADRLIGSRPALAALLGLYLTFTGVWPKEARARADMPAENQAKVHLAAALRFLGENVPPGVLLADVETRLLLGHYLAGRQWLPETRHLPSEEQIGPLRVFATRWAYTALDELVLDFKLYCARYHPPPGQPVWVMDAGFTSALIKRPEALLALWPRARPHRFGEGILLLEIPRQSDNADDVGDSVAPSREMLFPSAQR